jgi:antirestriction protein ArdC
LAAAFLCADLSIRGDLEHHASYVEEWLGVLRLDRKALFRAAADANEAVEFLNARQPQVHGHAA